MKVVTCYFCAISFAGYALVKVYHDTHRTLPNCPVWLFPTGDFGGSPSVRITLCSYNGLLLTLNRRYNDYTVHQYINEKQIVYGDL